MKRIRERLEEFNKALKGIKAALLLTKELKVQNIRLEDLRDMHSALVNIDDAISSIDKATDFLTKAIGYIKNIEPKEE